MEFNHSDLINGIIELTSAAFSAINIYRLHKDKQVKGFSVVPVIYFTIWGLWNLYFYPVNNLIWSFVGGIFIVVVNAIWIGQIFYYERKNKQVINKRY
jgi:ABC-type transport system involved in cytochrome c biogenesis permease subunit